MKIDLKEAGVFEISQKIQEEAFKFNRFYAEAKDRVTKEVDEAYTKYLRASDEQWLLIKEKLISQNLITEEVYQEGISINHEKGIIIMTKDIEGV